MKDQISITDTEQEINLETNKEDRMSLFIKSIFGIVPFGSPIGEAITSVIPHQKIERLVDFVQILNYKIKNAERKIEEQELKTEEFTDLLEDALGQASRELSKERLEHIASLLKNSLTDEELDYLEMKKILSLLGDLNDAEIIWLQYYTPIGHGSQEFLDKHEKVLNVRPLYQDCSKAEEFKLAIKKSYEENLVRHELLNENYDLSSQERVPEIDRNTGKFRVRRSISTLGYLLLETIDINTKED